MLEKLSNFPIVSHGCHSLVLKISKLKYACTAIGDTVYFKNFPNFTSLLVKDTKNNFEILLPQYLCHTPINIKVRTELHNNKYY